MVYYCIRTITQKKGGDILSWQFDSISPVFLQVATRIKGEIVKGNYPPDSQIPSVRQLATDASVNPNTMQRALTTLEEEGLLYSKGTVGRFVTSDREILSGLKKQLSDDLAARVTAEALSLGISDEELIDSIRNHSKEDHT